MRLFGTDVLLVASIALVASARAAGGGRQAGRLVAAALFTVTLVQFGHFYVDYFKGFQARRSSEIEGNVRVALETAIDRAGEHPVPALYVERGRAELGGGELTGLGALYARFYLLKRERQDLIPRTIDGGTYGAFEPDRIRHLPSGSIVIANTSAATTSQSIR